MVNSDLPWNTRFTVKSRVFSGRTGRAMMGFALMPRGHSPHSGSKLDKLWIRAIIVFYVRGLE